MTDPVVMARDLVGQWQCEWRDRVGIEAEVDVGQAIDLMDRIAAALAQRDARIAELEQALAVALERASDALQCVQDHGWEEGEDARLIDLAMFTTEALALLPPAAPGEP